jgi:hypothetical protein
MGLGLGAFHVLISLKMSEEKPRLMGAGMSKSNLCVRSPKANQFMGLMRAEIVQVRLI